MAAKHMPLNMVVAVRDVVQMCVLFEMKRYLLTSEPFTFQNLLILVEERTQE